MTQAGLYWHNVPIELSGLRTKLGVCSRALVWGSYYNLGSSQGYTAPSVPEIDAPIANACSAR
eukprot:1967961-Pyramimonas_sp.AAC.1